MIQTAGLGTEEMISSNGISGAEEMIQTGSRFRGREPRSVERITTYIYQDLQFDVIEGNLLSKLLLKFGWSRGGRTL